MIFLHGDREPYRTMVGIIGDTIGETMGFNPKADRMPVLFKFGNDDPEVEMLAAYFKKLGDPRMEKMARDPIDDGHVLISTDGKPVDGGRKGFRLVFVRVGIKSGDTAPVDVLATSVLEYLSSAGVLSRKAGKDDVIGIVGKILERYFEKFHELPLSMDYWTGMSKISADSKTYREAAIMPAVEFEKYVKGKMDGGYIAIFSDNARLVKEFSSASGFFKPDPRPYMFVDKAGVAKRFGLNEDAVKDLLALKLVGAPGDGRSVEAIRGCSDGDASAVAVAVRDCLYRWLDSGGIPP
jgi:hypothetical protein